MFSLLNDKSILCSKVVWCEYSCFFLAKVIYSFAVTMTLGIDNYDMYPLFLKFNYVYTEFSVLG